MQEGFGAANLVGDCADDVLALEAVAHAVAGEARRRDLRAANVALRVFAEQQNPGVGRAQTPVLLRQAAAPEQRRFDFGFVDAAERR